MERAVGTPEETTDSAPDIREAELEKLGMDGEGTHRQLMLIR